MSPSARLRRLGPIALPALSALSLACGGKGGDTGVCEAPALRSADWAAGDLDQDEGQAGVAWSAALAGGYLRRVQRPADCVDDSGDGCMPFVYQYDPRTGEGEDDESIHRQVVGTLALARLAKVTGEERLRQGAEDALTLLVGQAVILSDGRIRLSDLGATGLLVMAIAEYERATGDARFHSTLEGAGATVLAAVAPDGSFNEGSALVWAQLHHALWNLWTATGDAAYHEALERVVAYADTQQGDTGVGGYFEFPYIYGLWANEPITELYRERPDEALPALVFAVGDDVLSRQYSDRGTGVSPSDCAYTGGWTPTDGHSAPNWNHTIKLEAMADAYRMAELTDDADRIERYGHAARIGAAWLMGDQYRGDETDTFAVPGEAIGGIPLFEGDPDVRVDIPGHGSIALLKVSQWVVGEAAPGSL